MARDEGMFTTLDRNATTIVKLGNGDTMKATGKGKILAQTKSGLKIIEDVLYIDRFTTTRFDSRKCTRSVCNTMAE